MNNHGRDLRSWQLRPALDALQSGGVIAYPTEAVWGLGCDPYDASAFDRLLALKRRPLKKGVILVASHYQQLGSLLQQLEHEHRARLQVKQERPTTWLLPADDSIPPWICGEHNSVAVRISDHPAVKSLCEAFGGMIVSTSANIAGLPAARSQLKVRCTFKTAVDAYVAGAVGGELLPSRIVDLASGDIYR